MKGRSLIIFITMLAIAGSAGLNHVDAQMNERLTKAQRQREKERVITERATQSIESSIKAGKPPKYGKLLQSTNFELMYTEGLRYYHMKKKGKDYNTSGNYVKAQNLLDRASSYVAGTPREDSLFYYLGCSFYKNGEFEVSEQVFDNFRRRYSNSRFIEDVEYMYAMGFYFSSPDPAYDQTKTLMAMIAMSEYEGRYPNTVKKAEIAERMEEMRQKLYTKSFENAKLYYTIGQHKAAVRALNNAIDEFPESPYREELMFLATKSAYMFAKNSVANLMTDRYMSMMDNYYNLISEYPGTAHLKEVQKMRDEAMEHISDNTTEEVTIPENGN